MDISEKVRARLEVARVGRLATVSPMSTPHVIPICFVFFRSIFYSAIDRKPKNQQRGQLVRLTNIERNPAVSLLVDEYDEDWQRLWYVLIHGSAGAVTDEAEHRAAIAQLKAKYTQYASGMLDEDAKILRIVPERITGWGNL